MILMVFFVWPTINKSLTVMALVLCLFLVLTLPIHGAMVLTFLPVPGWVISWSCGVQPGECWTYLQLSEAAISLLSWLTDAAVAFWRVRELYFLFEPQLKKLLFPSPQLMNFISSGI